jgi:alpha,alpha-trehalase
MKIRRFYKDYHQKKNTKTPSEHIAALYPLFLELQMRIRQAVAKY